MEVLLRLPCFHKLVLTKALALFAVLVIIMFTTYYHYQIHKHQLSVTDTHRHHVAVPNTLLINKTIIGQTESQKPSDPVKNNRYFDKNILKSRKISGGKQLHVNIIDQDHGYVRHAHYEECITNLIETKTCVHTSAPRKSQEPSEACRDTRCSLSACEIRVLGYAANSTAKHVRLTINNTLVFSINGIPGIYLTLLAENCSFLEVHRFNNKNGTELLYYLASVRQGNTVVAISAGGYLPGLSVQLAFRKLLGVEVKGGFKSDGILSFVGRIGYPSFTETVWDSRKTSDMDKTYHYYIGEEMPHHEKALSWDELETFHTKVEQGGTYRPSDCIPKYTVAIIVPFRDREEHLKIFINNIIPFLKAQMIAFTIFVVEPDPPQVFNKAASMNIAYLEVSKLSSFDCYIFHDVDVYPLDLCNSYYCSNKPRHLVAAMNKYGFSTPYKSYVGGALILNTEHLTTINGFSNRFYGWGGEDDEIYARLRKTNLGFTRPPSIIGRYNMIKHGPDSGNPRSGISMNKALANAKSLDADGLSSVDYNLTSIKRHQLYTHIHVRIPGPTNKQEVKTYMRKWAASFG